MKLSESLDLWFPGAVSLLVNMHSVATQTTRVLRFTCKVGDQRKSARAAEVETRSEF